VSDQALITVLAEALAAALEPLLERIERLERRVAELEAPDWLTLEQAAARYQRSTSGLRKRLQRGQLPGAVKDGNRWLVDRRVLDGALTAGTLARSNANMGRAPQERPRPRHRRG
jgi:hypothetical protein